MGESRACSAHTPLTPLSRSVGEGGCEPSALAVLPEVRSSGRGVFAASVEGRPEG